MTTALTPSPGVAPAISTAARGRVHSTVPDLASLNLDERVAFYTERLGVLLLALHPDIPTTPSWRGTAVSCTSGRATTL